jgi:hypothetical protein
VAELTTLAEAVAELVHNGGTVALRFDVHLQGDDEAVCSGLGF